MNTEVEKKVQQKLFALSEEKFRVFNARIIATVPFERVIGVKTPGLRQVAREMFDSPNREEFLTSLPHYYFEENQVHAFILEQIKEREEALRYIEIFLPYMETWATTDCLSPKAFKKNPPDIETIRKWIDSKHLYTSRFGMCMLMRYYLDRRFEKRFLDYIINVHSEEYYINIMRAWYFATALAKQWESTIPVLETGTLDEWTHRKTIQKACESFRVPEEHKKYLKSLK